MKKTVMDVFLEAQAKGCAVVAVQRHYSYLIGPTQSRAVDMLDAFARNYSEKEPPTLFLCDKQGIEHGWRHGKLLAEAGVDGVNIVASFQGRGPDSGLRISEGYHEESGMWLSVECNKDVNYPVYNYQPCYRAIGEAGDAAPAQWLNGKRPELILSDTPEGFRKRVIGFLEDLLKRGGRWIITTHFELCVLVHGIYVSGCDLGAIPENYIPPKGGGILIVSNGGEVQSFDYDADYNVIT